MPASAKTLKVLLAELASILESEASTADAETAGISDAQTADSDDDSEGWEEVDALSISNLDGM